jgi:hypothetical protein
MINSKALFVVYWLLLCLRLHCVETSWQTLAGLFNSSIIRHEILMHVAATIGNHIQSLTLMYTEYTISDDWLVIANIVLFFVVFLSTQTGSPVTLLLGVLNSLAE